MGNFYLEERLTKAELEWMPPCPYNIAMETNNYDILPVKPHEIRNFIRDQLDYDVRIQRINRSYGYNWTSTGNTWDGNYCSEKWWFWNFKFESKGDLTKFLLNFGEMCRDLPPNKQMKKFHETMKAEKNVHYDFQYTTFNN